jgi:hypothetical protein
MISAMIVAASTVAIVAIAGGKQGRLTPSPAPTYLHLQASLAVDLARRSAYHFGAGPKEKARKRAFSHVLFEEVRRRRTRTSCAP